MNTLNIFQISFIALFFNDYKLAAGQFFVNETQDRGFSSSFSKKMLICELATGSLRNLANFGVDRCDYKSGKIISTNERSENPSFIAFRLRRACED